MDKEIQIRIEAMEEDFVKYNLNAETRFNNIDDKFDDLKKLIIMGMKSEQKEEEFTDKVFNHSDEDVAAKMKPSKRDRQSIASIFTSNPPFTPAPETKLRKDLKTPQFLKDYVSNITSATEIKSNSSLVSEILIPESAKFTTISLKTIKLATEKLQLYRTENPIGASKLRLAYFFNITAMETIFNKQITLKNNVMDNFENPTRFYACDDDLFLAFLCDTVRPVSAEDHLLKLFTVIQPDYIDEDFQLKNFHKGPLSKAMNQITKLQTYDSFIRYNATARDLKVLIQPGWGKDDNPKMTKVILSFFGSLSKKITLGIGEEKLKKLTTDEVYEEIVKYIAKLGGQAHDLEINENTDNACPNVMAVFAKSKVKKFENAQRVTNSLRIIDDDTGEEKDEVCEVNFEESLQKPFRDLKQVGEEDDDLEEALMYMNQSPAQDSSKLPCYKTLHGEICDLKDKCPYSHSKEVLHKYAVSMYNKWKKCPYIHDSSHPPSKPAPKFFGQDNQRTTFMSRGNLKVLTGSPLDLIQTHDHN